MPNAKPPVLSVDLLLRSGSFVGQMPGHALIHRFCSDVERGGTPSVEDLRAVAHALRAAAGSVNMSQAMDEVGRRLGLAKRQGKGLSEEKQHLARASEIGQYMLEVTQRIDQGVAPKAAEKEVRERYAATLGIGDRAMRDRIRKHMEMARLILTALYGVELPAGIWK